MSEKKALNAHIKVRKVAILLDKSERWVKEEIKAGNLVGYRLGNEIVVPVESINKYLEDREIKAAAA